MKTRNMFVEVSALRQYGVTGLNYQADSSGALKTVTFGRVVRQRVSSQAQKYVLREEIGCRYKDKAVRTKGAYNETVDRLIAAGLEEETAKRAAFGAFTLMGFKVDEYGRTGDALLFTNEGMRRFAAAVRNHQLELQKVEKAEPKSVTKYRKRVAQADKAVMRGQALKHELSDALFGPSNVELALFGRPLFSLREYELYGAVQTAHAVAVSGAQPVFDHFSVRDDYERGRFATAHTDVTQFMSSTLYSYTTVDLLLLTENLGGDVDTALRAALDTVDLITKVFPTHRAAETAPYTLPFHMMITAGVNRSPLNLIAAFDKPVWDVDGEQVGAVKAVEAYWNKMRGMWGPQLAQFVTSCSTHPAGSKDVEATRSASPGEALEGLERWLDVHKQELQVAR